MAKPSRTFSANVSDRSIGIAGPDQIEYDLDNVFAMFDPSKTLRDGSPGGIGSDNLKTGLLPSGIIVMWSGAITDIPTGWHLCDGTSGTPDLRDRFIVGAGSSYAVGATGGEAQHTLTIAEMPSHTHSVVAFGGTGGANPSGGSTGIVTATGATGGGGAHENRPPYYALAYIMKL